MSTDTTPLHPASEAGVDATLVPGPCYGPHIEETVKKTKHTETGEPSVSTGDSKAISIHSIPEDVLLEIFDSCREDESRSAYIKHLLLEQQLLHVCQRWRNLIFASSSRLDLQLICSPGTPVRKGLGWWPAFPIILDYDTVASKDEANVIAALEHPDRVRSVTLSVITRKLWQKLDAAMQKPFPVLTQLHLTGPEDNDERAPMLPSNLLGEGALRLKSLDLRGMSYPALPKLLLSARDLVELCFANIPSTCCISPEEMLTGTSFSGNHHHPRFVTRRIWGREGTRILRLLHHRSPVHTLHVNL